MLDTTKARRRYDALVSSAARRTFTATAWYGMAMRLWKAARTTEGGYRLTLEARAIDCEERAKRAARQAARNAANVAELAAAHAELDAADRPTCGRWDCTELCDPDATFCASCEQGYRDARNRRSEAA